MTKQESIEKLKELAFELPSVSDDEGYTDALRYAVETLEHCNLDEWCTDCKEYDHDAHSCPRFNRVIRHTAEEMQQSRWIPCSERLPGECGCYLVTRKRPRGGSMINLCIYDCGDKKVAQGWYCYDSEWGNVRVDNVIAWMPLPEPYEGG